MMLIINFVVCAIGFLNKVATRDIRPARSMPAISNSLINFGKMDISFYLNDKFKDALKKHGSSMHSSNSLFPSAHDTTHDEPCPCSNFRNVKDPFSSHPSEILNKVLTSNDLFSFNKELLSSSLCCDSHESVHEEGVFFEFFPKQNHMLSNPVQNNQLIFPSLTKVLENVMPRRPTLPIKPPAIDIFLLPKKKIVTVPQIESVSITKPDVHAVGDNEIKENMKAFSSPAFSYKSSVKKDLGKKKLEEDTLPGSKPELINSVTNKSNII